MTTSTARLPINSLLDFDVLETAKLLEYQLREVESYVQEIKTSRDKNRARRKRLDKELASLNAQLHQECALTLKVAARFRLTTAGGSWFPDRAIYDLLDDTYLASLPPPARAPSSRSITYPDDPWNSQVSFGPVMQAASSFIEHPEPFNENYVLNSSSRTSPLAFDNSNFRFTPPTLFPDPYYLPLPPPSSDTFANSMSAYTHASDDAPPLERRALGAIQETGNGESTAVVEQDSLMKTRSKSRSTVWRQLWV